MSSPDPGPAGASPVAASLTLPVAADGAIAPFPAELWGPPDGPARAWWKTLLGSVLWTLVPVVGWGMAVQWVQTRGRPEHFVPGDALRTSLVWAGGMLLGLALLVVLAVGLAALLGRG